MKNLPFAGLFTGYRVALGSLLLLTIGSEYTSCRSLRSANTSNPPARPEVLAAMRLANGYWQQTHPDPGNPFWDNTAFHTGNREALQLLDKKTFLPVVAKSWRNLTQTSLQSDGKLGYVQPIGERAIPGQVVDKHSTANFGVGAFLLAAGEMARLTDKK